MHIKKVSVYAIYFQEGSLQEQFNNQNFQEQFNNQNILFRIDIVIGILTGYDYLHDVIGLVHNRLEPK